MSTGSSDTTTAEIDSRLLDAPRKRRPHKDDRSLVEDLIRIRLGFDTLGELQRSSTLTDEEADEIAVRTVREARSAGR